MGQRWRIRSSRVLLRMSSLRWACYHGGRNHALEPPREGIRCGLSFSLQSSYRVGMDTSMDTTAV